MRAKKSVIILSGCVAILSIICFTILEFRIYNCFGIFTTKNPNASNLRDFFIVITSGLFTSSCVTLIISIREYYVSKEDALRNLFRLASYIDEKYKRVRFFKSDIPEEIVTSYLIYKCVYRCPEDVVDWVNEHGEDVDSGLRQLVEKDEEKVRKFRECVWENTQEGIKILYNSSEKKEKYLDEECTKLEEEYLQKIKEFIKSLRTFSDLDVYQVQEAFDKLCFFFTKRKKGLLEACFLTPLVINVKFIKFYLVLTSTETDLILHSLYAWLAINNSLLEYNKSREKAYLMPAYNIALGKATIEEMLGLRRRDKKELDIKEYAISSYPSFDFGEEIIIDSILRK